MTKPPFSHRIEAVLVRAAIAFLRLLPPDAASNVGGAVARVIGPFIPASRTVADTNLRMAMPELDARQRRAIVLAAWENLGRTTAELVRIGDLHETESGPGYYVTGWDENVAPELAKGGPSIFFTGHLGNWEIIPPAGFARGTDVAFMYRAASNKAVDDMMLGLREANFKRKVTMFPKGGTGARQAYSHMARGGHLGLMVDQKLDNGISVPFFGIPAMTAPALASFAIRFGCPVFPCYSVRTGPARLHVIFEPSLEIPDTGNKEADVLTLTTRMNETLERWIRANPGSWLWLHKRWPREVYKRK